MYRFCRQAFIAFSLVFILSAAAFPQSDQKLRKKALDNLAGWQNPFTGWLHISKPKIDSVVPISRQKKLTVMFTPDLVYYPFREKDIEIFSGSLKEALGKKFRTYSVDVLAGNYPLDQLVPNIYRTRMPVDSSRIGSGAQKSIKHVERESLYDPLNGLKDNSIALWHSHGYYYEMSLDRWEFQRAKLFGIVEDTYVMSYVLPYLVPMLERAGASVYLPRERDTQTNEVLVDNDRSTGSSEVVIQLEESESVTPGFRYCDTLYSHDNPFTKGTALAIIGDSVTYLPEIVEEGWYSVYISYPMTDYKPGLVSYVVNHTGGRTKFIVDQNAGGGTWIYLGTFNFDTGKDIKSGSVTVSSKSGKPFVTDAVRFGGGMGSVARHPSATITGNTQSAIVAGKDNITAAAEFPVFKWKTSGKPRFLEAARYYLQYAGMPDTLVYSPTAYRNDYNDDYLSRAAWVNHLNSAPELSASGLNRGGLGLPVDLAFAFHTDAGVTEGDSTIGTLAIYSTAVSPVPYRDEVSKLASRDLSDIIQTQVTEDIRKLYDPGWTRRGLWDKPYAEARYPSVPTMLLELLSHQNLADLKFGLDPAFRFAVCRSVYKGMLKYLSYNANRNYVVQPLPVSHFAIEYLGGKMIRLSWQPVKDPLEQSADPENYILYTAEEDSGFDNGHLVGDTSVTLELNSYGKIFNFKVTAVNSGGESFDSEVLSAGIMEHSSDPVLVVNGFDRVSGPAWFDKAGMAGIAWWKDRGVPYHYDFYTIGDQYEFDRSSLWMDDDDPGWGASWSDRAGEVNHGNTFDFTSVHGRSIMAAGRSFISVSDEFYSAGSILPGTYRVIDFLFGEEKTTKSWSDSLKHDFRIYTPGFMEVTRAHVLAGSNLLMSGSYLGTDLLITGDSSAVEFAARTLHFRHRTGSAVRTGGFYATDYARSFFMGKYTFNTMLSPAIYQAEATDALEPSGKEGLTAFRYAENNASAAVISKGKNSTVILGFPFETIIGEDSRNLLMHQILDFLKE
jgi:hypothetical protein